MIQANMEIAQYDIQIFLRKLGKKGNLKKKKRNFWQPNQLMSANQ